MGKIALFGAGEIGASLLKRLKAENINVDCFIDNKKNGEYCGLPVVNFHKLKKEPISVYIATLEYYDEIAEQLKQSHLKILGSKTYLRELIDSHSYIKNDVKFAIDSASAISHINCFSIDIVDSCQLKCPCCFRGIRTLKNSSNYMTLDTFEKVCQKIDHHNFEHVILYNWSEPFLKHNLASYVRVFRQVMGKDKFLGISSNLSLRKMPHLKPVLQTGVTELLVSVSGFSQPVHEIYHKGSSIKIVKKNLEYISSFINEISTRVVVKYLDFGYNAAELPIFEEYVRNLGFKFISVRGDGTPLTAHKQTYLDHLEEKLKGDLYEQWNMDTYMRSISMSCNSAFSIDYKADVYLCCCYPNLEQFKIGNYLEDTIEKLLVRKQLHPFCVGCDAKSNSLNL